MTLTASDLPPIIQGGMGVGVSGWRLARAVSKTGQLGVVSGTALDLLLTRNLQLGDPEGYLRRALEKFPNSDVVDRIFEKFFIPGGKDANAPFKTPPMFSHQPSTESAWLTIVAAFVAIHLAKENHEGLVGLNLLEKIQVPTLHVLLGAMLAGVDVVLVGAGIPRRIPKILDDFAAGRAAELRLDVAGATTPTVMKLDPQALGLSAVLKRPVFLAIVSSPVLAENLRRKADGRVDGFVVEASVAGGHNAPPRGQMQRNALGEPIYGERDRIDPAAFVKIGLPFCLEAMRALGVPFWLAGGYGKPGKLKEAQAAGAHGIQVGTAFALSEESGFEPVLKSRILGMLQRDELKIRTDATASPTGFPFKLANIPQSVADPKIYQDRGRICDLGVLREAYEKPDGTVGYRCSAEPRDAYFLKRGDVADTPERVCLCNSLCASVGIGQVRHGVPEPPLVTLGDDFSAVKEFLKAGNTGYTAADVVARLLE